MFSATFLFTRTSDFVRYVQKQHIIIFISLLLQKSLITAFACLGFGQPVLSLRERTCRSVILRSRNNRLVRTGHQEGQSEGNG